MPVFFLPKLKPDSELTLPDKSGEWQVYSRNRLKTLAKDLDYAAPGDRNLINSVPTMWAAALTMEMGLVDKSHPLHHDTVTQWQGMLAALALAKVYDLPLKVVRVDLEEYRHHQFAQALMSLVPTAKTHNLYELRNKNPWSDNYVWLYNDRPVGMTSPSTLVVPTIDGKWDDLPWWNRDSKRFRRPHDYLSTEYQALLKGWLLNLENQIANQDNPAAVNRLVALINDFQANLAGNISIGDIPSLLDDDTAYFGVPINTGILTALSQPAKPKNITSDNSHLRLIGSESKNPAQPLLILDLGIAKVWNVEPQDIRVHQEKNLASLNLDDLRSGKITNWTDVAWRETKDLFLPHLTFIRRETALPGGIVVSTNQPLMFNGDKITPLIPLDHILLEYFTPEDLIKRLKFTQSGTSNTIRVTLNLPLSGVNPQSKRPQEFQVYKDYPLEEQNALFGVPVLEVWPNFRLPSWQEYYAFYFDCELGERTFNVEFAQAKDPHSFEEDNGKYLITRLSEFPSYVRCVDSYKDSMGLILIKQPPVMNLTETWKVGVDFGTSFTNIYVNHKGAPEQLKINAQDERDSLHLKISESDPSTRINVLLEYFIPERFLPTDNPLPLASILTTRGETNRKPLRPIYDGRIYIPQYGNSEHREIENNYIKTDIKWEGIEESQLFLHHLSLLISAIAAKKGVKQIDWSISYPSVFSRKKLTKYATNWRSITAELQKQTGIKQICPEQPDFMTESLAIGYYFRDSTQQRGNLSRSVCIDLGGGTADISLWQNSDPIYQCSIQLAGRHLFSQLVELRPELLAKWFDNKDNWNNIAPDIFKTKIDVLLREKSDLWLKEERHKYEDDPAFLGFIRIVALGMAGLYYYVGTIVQVMQQEGKYKENKIPSIYMGGNGSRLLNWLVPTGEFSKFSSINELFNRMLSKASGLEESGDPTKVSKIPKDEVACGMVAAKRKLDKPLADHPISGENFALNGQEFAFSDRLNFDDLDGDITSFTIPTLSHLKEFVDAFNDAVVELKIEDIQPLATYKKRQGLDPAYSNKLWDKVDLELRPVLLDLRGNHEEIGENPPFILGLKVLLTVLAKEWADR